MKIKLPSKKNIFYGIVIVCVAILLLVQITDIFLTKDIRSEMKAKQAIAAGANILVAGSAVFKAADRRAVIEKLRG